MLGPKSSNLIGGVFASRPLMGGAMAVALSSTAALAEVPRVAVDIAPIHSLVAMVMGDVGTPDLILPANASPHSYSLRPSEARTLERADLVVWVGEGLTPWLEDPLETLASDAKMLELMESEGAILFDIRTDPVFEAHNHDHDDHDDHDHEDHASDDHDDDHDHDDHASDDHDHDHEDHAHDDDDHDHEDHASDKDDHGHDDHDDHAHDDHDHAHDDHDHDHDEHAHDDHDHEKHEDEDHASHDHDHEHDHEDHAADEHGHDDHHDHAHGSVDPHIWLHPDNAKVVVASVAGALSELDPENAAQYEANATAATATLEALEAEVSGALSELGDVDLIVFHDAYRYFEEAFGFSAAGAISVSEATKPSAARMQELRGLVAELDAPCMAAEPQYDPGILDAIAEGTGASYVVLDPLGAAFEAGPTLYTDVISGLAQSLAECASGS